MCRLSITPGHCTTPVMATHLYIKVRLGLLDDIVSILIKEWVFMLSQSESALVLKTTFQYTFK